MKFETFMLCTMVYITVYFTVILKNSPIPTTYEDSPTTIKTFCYEVMKIEHIKTSQGIAPRIDKNGIFIMCKTDETKKD